MYYGLIAFNAFCCANVAKNIYRLRIFRTILWMIPSLYSYRLFITSFQHLGLLIKKLELMDDGKHVLVTLRSNTSTLYPIKDFHQDEVTDLIDLYYCLNYFFVG